MFQTLVFLDSLILARAAAEPAANAAAMYCPKIIMPENIQTEERKIKGGG